MLGETKSPPNNILVRIRYEVVLALEGKVLLLRYLYTRHCTTHVLMVKKTHYCPSPGTPTMVLNIKLIAETIILPVPETQETREQFFRKEVEQSSLVPILNNSNTPFYSDFPADYNARPHARSQRLP